MRHFASPSFWENYEKLPGNIRTLADKNYALLKANTRHPSNNQRVHHLYASKAAEIAIRRPQQADAKLLA